MTFIELLIAALMTGLTIGVIGVAFIAPIAFCMWVFGIIVDAVSERWSGK